MGGMGEGVMREWLNGDGGGTGKYLQEKVKKEGEKEREGEKKERKTRRSRRRRRKTRRRRRKE